MAALIKDTLNLDTDLEPGGRGEFTVWVDGVKVAEKIPHRFPGRAGILEAVSKAVVQEPPRRRA